MSTGTYSSTTQVYTLTTLSEYVRHDTYSSTGTSTGRVASLAVLRRPMLATDSGDAAPDYDIEAPRFDHHGRTWASWTHTAFMRQAVACATAVATFGGATYAAKCEMRDLHSAASHHQVGELAEDAEPLEPMPEPMCSA